MPYLKETTRLLGLVCMFGAGSAAAASWSGFYAGLNMTSATVETDWSTTETRSHDGAVIPPSSDPAASLESTETGSGVIIGYNWNTGSGWIFGVDAATGSTEHADTIDDRIPGLGVASSTPSSFVDVKTETDGLVLRLRGGYLLTPDLLLYGTIGKTHLDVEITSTCPADINVCTVTEAYRNTGSVNATAVGAGLEYAIKGFRARLQYSAADFGGPGFTALPDVEGLSFGADAKAEFAAAFVQLGVTYDF